MSFRERITNRYWNIIKYHFPYLWCKFLSKKQLGKFTNFNHPRDINEKIQWLEFFTDTSQWALLADKYAVREYVKERISDDILVPLLGKWDCAEDINFDSLPQKFVIKPNNGSYDCVIVQDKMQIDCEAIRKKMAHSLKTPFGFENAEPHYTHIKPCIIAEKLLETHDALGLIDYKFFCLNGKVHHIFVCGDRDVVNHTCDWVYYDTDWKRYEDKIAPPFRNDFACPKPKGFELMKVYAELLANGLPQVRVDLYNIAGQIYFGEMTLTSNFGMIPYYTQDVLDEMGDLCELPQRSVKEKIHTFFKRWMPVL